MPECRIINSNLLSYGDLLPHCSKYTAYNEWVKIRDMPFAAALLSLEKKLKTAEAYEILVEINAIIRSIDQTLTKKVPLPQIGKTPPYYCTQYVDDLTTEEKGVVRLLKAKCLYIQDKLSTPGFSKEEALAPFEVKSSGRGASNSYANEELHLQAIRAYLPKAHPQPSVKALAQVGHFSTHDTAPKAPALTQESLNLK